jgi:hypothetical protein
MASKRTYGASNAGGSTTSDLNHPSYFKRLDKLLASHSTKPCSFIGLSSFNIVP